jgi:hypothetical protein
MPASESRNTRVRRSIEYGAMAPPAAEVPWSRYYGQIENALVHSTPKVVRTHDVSAGGSWLSSQIVTSRRDEWMCQATAREPEAGRYVLEF